MTFVDTGSVFSQLISYLSVAAFSYLMGSIPFGLLVAKFAGYGDIRNIGSGNIGATNVLRTGNKTLAALTLLLDALKSLTPIIIFMTDKEFGHQLGAIAFIFVIIGHMFPVWLKFKGGKGVATGLGGLFAICWPIGCIAFAVWIITAYFTRLSSLAALVAVATSAFIALFTLDFILVISIAIVSLLILYRHKDNLDRLRIGTEPKMKFGK